MLCASPSAFHNKHSKIKREHLVSFQSTSHHLWHLQTQTVPQGITVMQPVRRVGASEVAAISFAFGNNTWPPQALLLHFGRGRTEYSWFEGICVVIVTGDTVGDGYPGLECVEDGTVRQPRQDNGAARADFQARRKIFHLPLDRLLRGPIFTFCESPGTDVRGRVWKTPLGA